MGIPCEPENIFSSGLAAGFFLSRKRKGKKVYLVGTEALAAELSEYGIVTTVNCLLYTSIDYKSIALPVELSRRAKMVENDGLEPPTLCL